MISFEMFLESQTNVRLPEENIYTFYFLYTLIQTAKIKNWDISKFKDKILDFSYSIHSIYIARFSHIIYSQLQKYQQAGRVTPDFEIPNNAYDSVEELRDAMEKTFRSDMTRKNDNWIDLSNWLVKLSAINPDKIEDTFFIIDRINNTIHNTGESMLSKFSNSSELTTAFDRCHEFKSLNDFEPYISSSWKALLEVAKESIKDMKKPMAVAIDYVYDLCHNNNTVFDKLKEYNKNGYGWIENALDFRADLKNYYEILPMCSDVVKAIAPPVLYNKLGQSWQSTLQDELVNFDISNYDKQPYSRIEDVKKGDWVIIGYDKTPKKIAANGKATTKMGHGNRSILYINPSGSGTSRADYQNVSKLIPKVKPEIENDPVQNPQGPTLNPADEVDTNVKASPPEQDNSKVKRGDMVKCVNNKPDWEDELTIGKLYKVLKVDGEGMLLIRTNNNMEIYFQAYRFEKVTDGITKPSNDDSVYDTDYLSWKPGEIIVSLETKLHIEKDAKYKIIKIQYNQSIPKHTLVTIESPKTDLPVDIFAKRFKRLTPPQNTPSDSSSSEPTSNRPQTSLTGDPSDGVKIGDKVICIRIIPAYKNKLTVGKEYTIIDIEYEDHLDTIYKVHGDDGQPVGAFYYRFDKIPSKEPLKESPPTSDIKTDEDYKSWKAGDIVIAKETTQGIIRGKKYKITSIRPTNDHPMYQMVMITGRGYKGYGLYAFRFKRITPTDRPSKPTPSSTSEEPVTFENVKIGDMVKCVDNGGIPTRLTIGKIYKVINKDDKHIRIVDNTNNEFGYYMYKFVTVPSQRKTMPTVAPPPTSPPSDDNKFKVGDHVKFKKALYGLVTNDKDPIIHGTVVDVSDGTTHIKNTIGVKFQYTDDKGRPQEHTIYVFKLDLYPDDQI